MPTSAARPALRWARVLRGCGGCGAGHWVADRRPEVILGVVRRGTGLGSQLGVLAAFATPAVLGHCRRCVPKVAVTAGSAIAWKMTSWHEHGMLHMMGHVARGYLAVKRATRCWTSEDDSTAWHMRGRVGGRTLPCMQAETDVDRAASKLAAERGIRGGPWRKIDASGKPSRWTARDTRPRPSARPPRAIATRPSNDSGSAYAGRMKGSAARCAREDVFRRIARERKRSGGGCACMLEACTQNRGAMHAESQSIAGPWPCLARQAPTCRVLRRRDGEAERRPVAVGSSWRSSSRDSARRRSAVFVPPDGGGLVGPTPGSLLRLRCVHLHVRAAGDTTTLQTFGGALRQGCWECLFACRGGVRVGSGCGCA